MNETKLKVQSKESREQKALEPKLKTQNTK